MSASGDNLIGDLPDRHKTTVLSPAKINLFLAITGRRPDGYHHLFSLFCTLDGLHDRLTLETIPAGIQFSCDDPQLPTDDTNLAHRAALAFFRQTGLPTGIRIHLQKRIPVGAGLGGGSSNAATVLKNLNQLFEYPLSESSLHRLALNIGADVPFFLSGRAALASGIGERLTPFEGLPAYPVVVVYPRIAVSTKWVYQNLDLGLTKCKKTLKYTLLKQEGFNPARHLCNDLESVTIARYPQIAEVKRRLVENRALGALMTGSGSSVFGLFETLEQAKQTKRVLDAYGDVDSYLATLGG